MTKANAQSAIFTYTASTTIDNQTAHKLSVIPPHCVNKDCDDANGDLTFSYYL
jgi:hypothetical protein